MPSDYPIKLGSLLFTLVEPERGHEVEYNRWYERDHFYAGCMIGPWQFSGARFVATREEKARRSSGPNPVTGDGTRGTYLAPLPSSLPSARSFVKRKDSLRKGTERGAPRWRAAQIAGAAASSWEFSAVAYAPLKMPRNVGGAPLLGAGVPPLGLS